MYPPTGEAAIRLDTGIFLLIYLLAFTLKEIILWKDSNIRWRPRPQVTGYFLKTEIFFSVKSLRGDEAPVTYKHFSTLFWSRVLIEGISETLIVV